MRMHNEVDSQREWNKKSLLIHAHKALFSPNLFQLNFSVHQFMLRNTIFCTQLFAVFISSIAAFANNFLLYSAYPELFGRFKVWLNSLTIRF